jgi:predicted Rossmann fold nucleotide-binding protein DprA/Smf involved in DNA uptake
MLSNDALAMIMLCSRMGLDPDPDPKPLTLREWNPLAYKIQNSSLETPGALLGLSVSELQKALDIDQKQAEELWVLMDRSGVIAIELERVESIGIKVITSADKDYPERYRNLLKESAPAILFYSGEKALLGQRGIAVVGSRQLDHIGERAAELIGNACGLSGLVLYSGGAKGVDTLSMDASLDARGTAVGVIANNLERIIRTPLYRNAIQRGNLCLVTPYLPSAPFSVGNAMGRNRLIYTLADYAIVVSSSANSGGTWAGATQNLKNNWVSLFVLEYENMPEGNALLIKNGAISLPQSVTEDHKQFIEYLEKMSATGFIKPEQLGLF